MLWAHVEEPPPSVTEERPELPTEVDVVVASRWRRTRTSAPRRRARSPRGSGRPSGSRRLPARHGAVRRLGKRQGSPRRRTLVAAIVVSRRARAGAGMYLLARWGCEPTSLRRRRTRSPDRLVTNGSRQAVRVGEDPTGVAIGEDGDLWVINQGDSTVSRVDPESGENVDEVHARHPHRRRSRRGRRLDHQRVRWPERDGRSCRSTSPTSRSSSRSPIGEREGDRGRRSGRSGSPTPIATVCSGTTRRTSTRRRPRSRPTMTRTPSAAPRSLSVGSGAAEGIWVVNELGDTVVRIDPETNEVAQSDPGRVTDGRRGGRKRHLGDQRAQRPRASLRPGGEGPCGPSITPTASSTVPRRS